jgi:hypothetical protein
MAMTSNEEWLYGRGIINDQPTEKQLERIYALLEHPAINGDYLDSLGEKVDQLIKTKKGAGVLIGILKRKTGWDGKTPLD